MELRPPEYMPQLGEASSEPPVTGTHTAFPNLPRPAGKSLCARSQPSTTHGGQLWGGWSRAMLPANPVQVQVLQTHHHHHPLCDIPSGCCLFTGPWTTTGRRRRAKGTSCHIQHSPSTPTTGLHERRNHTSRSTSCSGQQKAATRCNMQR